MFDGRWLALAVGREVGVAGGDSGRRYWLVTLVLQLLLQALDVGAQAGIFAIEVLGMATGAGEACDAVCCTTFGVVLGAGRAAAGLGVAADLSCLREGRRMSVGGGGGGAVRTGCSCVYVCVYIWMHVLNI